MDLEVHGRVGERFARSLAAKDAATLKAILRSEVDFRAMTPGRFWEATEANVVVDEIMLGAWFNPQRPIIELLAVETTSVGSLDRLAYRLKVERPEGESIVEQQVYFETDHGKISWLQIMCTGFLPLS